MSKAFDELMKMIDELSAEQKLILVRDYRDQVDSAMFWLNPPLPQSLSETMVTSVLNDIREKIAEVKTKVKYKTGDIVLIETETYEFGKCELVGVVRYYDVADDAYEINVMASPGEGCIDQRLIHWWCVSDRHIKAKLAEQKTERMPEIPKGKYVAEVYVF